MKMVISFDMDNDAFHPDGSAMNGMESIVTGELDRIFQRISDSVWEGNTEGRIRDSNGNTVGRWGIES